ncbi:MAG: hypothetical protein COV48_17180 [Elusimicrobia bacterium CG11_big_fil_rev_8_21_14_0_20_64_6]|nr:MAG: hypothetical protein COV48_17180 [Elusimicrobia bacterium CG11_big_fil_rev_8_21_14_0_20_64_6]
MRLSPAILVLLLALPCAALSPDTAPSVRMEKEFARLEAQASASPAARRLFAATRHVPRREVRGSGLPDAIGVRGGAKPELVFDALRLPEVTETDAELLLMLNSARAFLAFPIPIVEAEQAAWQWTLLFAVERGAEDAAVFGTRLAGAVRAAGSRSEALDRSALPPRSPWELAETPVLKLPEDALERAGLLLYLLEKDPDRFYWAVEAGSAWPRGSARLSEIEDLYSLRGVDIAALRVPPEGPYTTLGGRRYASSLVRTAFLLRGSGEVERLREGLEAYDSVGLAAMRSAINRWRRAVGK